MAKPLSRSDLEGRWELLSWIQEYDDGRRIYPLGEQVEGFIDYCTGRMSCMMSRKPRSPFVSGGQWDASRDEKASAYDGFMAYWGRFDIHGDEVVHRVEGSLFPNWTGGEQRRKAKLDGNKLYLTARLETGTPEARTASLLWRRLTD